MRRRDVARSRGRAGGALALGGVVRTGAAGTRVGRRAGRDAALLPLLFGSSIDPVPEGGISHSPRTRTRPADCTSGAHVLRPAVLAVDARRVG